MKNGILNNLAVMWAYQSSTAPDKALQPCLHTTLHALYLAELDSVT